MRENLSILIEGREIILIKYFILFLTICYSQLVVIQVYYSCKKKLVLASPITHDFFLFFGGKIIFLLKYNHHCEYFY